MCLTLSTILIQNLRLLLENEWLFVFSLLKGWKNNSFPILWYSSSLIERKKIKKNPLVSFPDRQPPPPPPFYNHKVEGTFKLNDFFKTYLIFFFFFIHQSGYYIAMMMFIEVHYMFYQLLETEVGIQIKFRLSFKHMPNIEQKKFMLRMILTIVKDSICSWKSKGK